jgi:hypothetical protein
MESNQSTVRTLSDGTEVTINQYIQAKYDTLRYKNIKNAFQMIVDSTDSREDFHAIFSALEELYDKKFSGNSGTSLEA